MSDETKKVDTRELSRSGCACGPANAHDHMMATEVGSLQRIADSLERIEIIAFTALFSGGGDEVLKLLEPSHIQQLKILVSRQLPGITEPIQAPKSEPSQASELKGDRPNNHASFPPNQRV